MSITNKKFYVHLQEKGGAFQIMDRYYQYKGYPKGQLEKHEIAVAWFRPDALRICNALNAMEASRTAKQHPQVRICYLRKLCVDKGPGKVCMLPYRAQYLSCLGSKRQTVR